MNINYQNEEGATVVNIDGDIDMSGASNLRNALLDQLNKDPQKLVIDFTQVGFIDSSGIAVLVETLKVSQNKKIALIFCSMNEKVKDVFELAQLDKVFSIVANLQEALS